MTSTVRYFDDRGRKTIPGRASLVAKDDYDALAAELATMKKMYAYEGRKAMIEAERAEAAEARVKELEALLEEAATVASLRAARASMEKHNE